MVVISKTKLAEFGQNHADAIEAINEWYEKTKQADWGSLKDIKGTFNSVDYAGNDLTTPISRETSTDSLP